MIVGEGALRFAKAHGALAPLPGPHALRARPDEQKGRHSNEHAVQRDPLRHFLAQDAEQLRVEYRRRASEVARDEAQPPVEYFEEESP